MPTVLAVPGVAFEQEAAGLYPPVDPLDVHRRGALFASPAPAQGVDAAIAAGRLPGDRCLDRSQQLGFRLRMPAPAPCRERCRLHDEV